MREELSFDRAEPDLTEFHQLHGFGGKGIAVDADSYAAAKPVEPTGLDIEILDKIKAALAEKALPYSVSMVSVSGSVFKGVEPAYSGGDKKCLLCCFECGLSDMEWAFLESLQEKFGNLSNESISIITSLEEIIDKRFYIAWGHDRVLKQFFGGKIGQRMKLVPGIEVIRFHGAPHYSYSYYLERFQFNITPFGGGTRIKKWRQIAALFVWSQNDIIRIGV